MAPLIPPFRRYPLLAPLLLLPPLAACSGGGEDPERPTERAVSAPAGERSGTPAAALATRFELPVAGKPEGVLALDLDGDGRDELLSLSKTPGVLTLYTHLPSGWELGSARLEIPVGDYALGPVAVRGADGRQRVALASRAARELTLIDPLAPEGQRLTARQLLDAAPRAIASGDLGGDGSVEVVVVDGAGTLVIRGDDGTIREVPTGRTLASCVHVYGDGSGVVIGDQGTREVLFFRLDASGALELESATELNGMPRAFTELDLDGDGDPELLVAGGDRSVWLFGAKGKGGSRAWPEDRKPIERELEAIPLAAATGVFDSSGAERAVVLSHLGLRYHVLNGLEGRAGGIAEYSGQAPWDLDAGDFDGDGRADLAIANREAARVSLLYGAVGGGFREALRLPTGRAPHSVAAADYDGDGDVDLAVINALEDSLVFLYREGSEWRRSPRFNAGPGANHVRALPVDGQPAARVAWTTSDARGARLCLAFRDLARPEGAVIADQMVDVGSSSTALLFADLDGDGGLEAYVADHDAGALRRLPFAPESTDLLPEVQTLTLPASPTALAAVSIGGAPHLAITYRGESGVGGIALVRAAGATVELARTIDLSRPPISIAAADVDGDERSDLVILSGPSGGESVGRVQVRLQRDGDRWKPLPLAVTGQRPYAVATGDLNGDGRADVVVSSQNSHNVNLWLAASGASPGLVRQADLGVGMGSLGLEIVDLDGDGVPEIVVANAFSHDCSIVTR